MRQPTWQEIEAEAQRRGKLDFDNTGRSWTLAEKIVEVMNEGWTPPDPRREAYLQWRDTVGPTVPFENAFYAGADRALAAYGSLDARQKAWFESVNRAGLQEFWALSPTDALGLKSEMERLRAAETDAA